MSIIVNKVNYELLKILSECRAAADDDKEGFNFLPYIKRITDISELAIVDREAELPKFKPSLSASKDENNMVQLGYNCCRQDMAGWVKEIKDV